MVEADPHCGYARQLRRIEQKLFNLEFKAVGEDLDVVERALRERSEQRSVNTAVAETLSLAERRSETVETEKSGQVQILNRDGLLWLRKKRRLSNAESVALERYRELFGQVHRGPTGSAFDATSGGKSGYSEGSPLVRTQLVWSLDDAREALSHDKILVWLLDEVAGRGATLRDLAKGDDREATRLESELRVAARLLAKFFGYTS